MKWNRASETKHPMGSPVGSDISFFRQSSKGASQLVVRPETRERTFEDVAGSDRSSPSGIGWKVKWAYLEASGELKFVWMIAMEKPLEWRIWASWSIGFMWPCSGKGKSTTRRPFLCSITELAGGPTPCRRFRVRLEEENGPVGIRNSLPRPRAVYEISIDFQFNEWMGSGK